MDINFLRYFQTVATLEHMTRAAEVLHISQPALSMAISKLEQELGVPLFDRQGRGVKLNAFGEILLSHVDLVLTEIDATKQEIEELKNTQESSLGLVTNLSNSLNGLMDDFDKNHPHISIRKTVLPWAQLEDQLRSGNANFCIATPPVTGPGMTCLTLCRFDFYLLTGKRHRLAGSTGVHLAEVAQEPFIGFQNGYSDQMRAMAACRRAGFNPHVLFTINNAQELLKYVRRGLGVALLPVPFWNLPLNNISAIPLLDPISPSITAMTYLEGSYFSAAAQDFKTAVLDYFAAYSG